MNCIANSYCVKVLYTHSEGIGKGTSFNSIILISNYTKTIGGMGKGNQYKLGKPVNVFHSGAKYITKNEIKIMHQIWNKFNYKNVFSHSDI